MIPVKRIQYVFLPFSPGIVDLLFHLKECADLAPLPRTPTPMVSKRELSEGGEWSN